VALQVVVGSLACFLRVLLGMQGARIGLVLVAVVALLRLMRFFDFGRWAVVAGLNRGNSADQSDQRVAARRCYG